MITIPANASDLIKHTGGTIISSEKTKQTWIKFQQRPGASQQQNIHTLNKTAARKRIKTLNPFI